MKFRGSAEFCSWDGAALAICTDSGKIGWRGALQKWVLFDGKLNISLQHALAAKRATVFCGTSSTALIAG